MNTYKVESVTEVGEQTTHVTATSCESAVFEAFDELSDKGYTVKSIGTVWMFDDKTQQWVKTFSHKAVSAAVK